VTEKVDYEGRRGVLREYWEKEGKKAIKEEFGGGGHVKM